MVVGAGPRSGGGLQCETFVTVCGVVWVSCTEVG